MCNCAPTGVGFAVVAAVVAGTGTSAATWPDVAAASAFISLACLRLACHMDPAKPRTKAEAAPASSVLGCIGGSEAFFVFVDIASPAGCSLGTKLSIIFLTNWYQYSQNKKQSF
ncbi:hypothetical protein K450DRAFT_229506 [Umbelopsis ramanniana AG]|uniref:Secreted protein n=1 Tax=Umbelopsis ramanniana AG TaxID=1314678 RepID=A0AAD5EDE8_UMBRA|nr:uncharacterized protein K450DRAFT_229506 [Umbelopsis ramanniana AG]KAI8581848.1 hypothetical protein K450DRAFT_229506 [Umbelopsis ramanniana AG]